MRIYKRTLACLSFFIVVQAASAADTVAPSKALAKHAAAASFSFGLWGDMPYKKAKDELKLPRVLDSINRSNIAFSIYDGDIKDGSSACTDDVFTDALTMFNSMKRAVVYVPGDNEWTDCHRTNNGGYNALERLNHLRKVMYPTTRSLGKTSMPLMHQGALGQAYVENTRFVHQSIVFVGINMPGSNNNKIVDDKSCTQKSARTLEDCAASNAEFEQRDAANKDWLTQAFEHAKHIKAPGMVIVVQGDPVFDLPETEDVDESKSVHGTGYRSFMNALIQHTEQYSGQVLFVHGDTHFFKLDKPLYNPSKVLPNFTRLQTFGSPILHWVKVNVNPRTANVFQIEPVMVAH